MEQITVEVLVVAVVVVVMDFAMLNLVRPIVTGVSPDITFCGGSVFLSLFEYNDPFITSKNFLDPHMLIVVAVSTVNEQGNNKTGSLHIL